MQGSQETNGCSHHDTSRSVVIVDPAGNGLLVSCYHDRWPNNASWNSYAVFAYQFFASCFWERVGVRPFSKYSVKISYDFEIYISMILDAQGRFWFNERWKDLNELLGCHMLQQIVIQHIDQGNDSVRIHGWLVKLLFDFLQYAVREGRWNVYKCLWQNNLT